MKLILAFGLILVGNISFSQNKKFLLGVDLGIDLPLGEAQEYAKTGFSWDINGEFLVTPQIGISLDLGQSLYSDGTKDYGYDFGSVFLTGRNIGTASYTYNIDMFSATLGANYHFKELSQGLGFYAGLGLVYNHIKLQTSVLDRGEVQVGSPFPVITTYENSLAFDNEFTTSVGIMPRFGINYGINENLSINFEAAFHLTGIKLSNSTLTTIGLEVSEAHLNTIPLKVGIRYAI